MVSTVRSTAILGILLIHTLAMLPRISFWIVMVIKVLK